MTLAGIALAFAAVFVGCVLGALCWYGAVVAVYVWPRPHLGGW